MASAFSTILIPVDFSINTEVAIKKAIDLAIPGITTLHLLHVVSHGGVFDNKYSHHADLLMPSPEDRITKLKQEILGKLPGIFVCNWVVNGSSVQKSIVAKSKRILPDLLIIGKSSHNRWFPFFDTIRATELSEQTGCAVLTVKPGSMHNSIKTIVVPVCQKIPQQKMDILNTLCKKQRLKVHLVSFMKDDHSPEQFSADALIKMYQWLKTVLHCPVEYAVIHGSNKPRALLTYAEKINADTLLLQPETETRIGWPNRHIADILPANSRMQVLTVQPPIESFT